MNSKTSDALRKAALALSLTLLIGPAACTHLFFNPGREMIVSPEVEKYSPRDVYFKSADGLLLHGWYFRTKQEEKGTILICHGNGENISTHVRLDLWLIDAGYNLFIFDYRGYGTSEGTPDVRGIHLDAEAALETVLFRLPRNDRDQGVIVFGKSLGGAVAVYTVAMTPYKNRIRALVVDSAFASYRMIAREKIAGSIIGWPLQYPLSLLVYDDYSPVKYIARVSPVPLVIIAGYRDPVVPEHHGRILYNAALPPKQFWEVRVPGHVVAQRDPAVRKKLLDFLAVARGRP